MNRINKLRMNTITSILYQITMILGGFVLPNIIIGSFGSEVNGLINSIKQFLQMIAFLEMGVGAVVQSALYKPLADNDKTKISEIVVSGSRFFKFIGQVLLVYVIFLALFYKKITTCNFSYFFVITLIIAISISYFAQYYFGLMDTFLLQSDQRGYIVYCTQIVTMVLNIVVCVIVAKIGLSIQVLQFSTAFIYLLRPIVFRLYINKHYDLNRKITYEEEPIKQKWDGIAQHIAAVVLDSTDIVVLTIFSTLNSVSIYSVYNMVVSGVRSLVNSVTLGTQALLGELWARGEYEKTKRFFSEFEWLINIVSIFIWSCTITLLVPFIKVYTYSISDIDYIYPLFAILITLANSMHSFRLPYNTLVLAVGHYKETRRCYIIAALINVVLSCIMVHKLGLIGVAIGTLISMGYQLIWMAIYCYRHVLKIEVHLFLKQLIVDAICLIGCMLISTRLTIMSVSYFGWLLLSIKTAVINFAIVLVFNFIFYKENVQSYIKKFLNKIK